MIKSEDFLAAIDLIKTALREGIVRHSGWIDYGKKPEVNQLWITKMGHGYISYYRSDRFDKSEIILNEGPVHLIETKDLLLEAKEHLKSKYESSLQRAAEANGEHSKVKEELHNLELQLAQLGIYK